MIRKPAAARLLASISCFCAQNAVAYAPFERSLLQRRSLRSNIVRYRLRARSSYALFSRVFSQFCARGVSADRQTTPTENARRRAAQSRIQPRLHPLTSER